MISASQPLRDEHRALLPELGVVLIAADAVGSPDGVEQFERALRLLHRHLLPHMAAEDAVLYPTLDRLTGADTMITMHRDHAEIRRRITALGGFHGDGSSDPAAQRHLRAALYGLDAIVRLHIAKEEELYHPLLDSALSADEAAQLIASMHEIERDPHQTAGDAPHATGLP